ncbi:MAG TPA: ABC transporter ATP-binding protein [Rhizomicrobium sp.]|nr:ABC transporter ATP-binding protein [Rhizomicrobium sp.]
MKLLSGSKAGIVRELLRPHLLTLSLALLAAIGESFADLLSPWPLKVVIDNVIKTKPLPPWVSHIVVALAGTDRLAIVRVAAIGAIVIAVLGAACAYIQKRGATTVGQWVMHDLRRTMYSHIQRLSLKFYDESHTGDLISRVTSDIDTIQSFITSDLLDAIIQSLTLVGMIAWMLYLDWRFTLVSLSVAPVLFAVVFRYTRIIKKSSREVRKKEGEIVSTIQEVITSIRVVKAFAREDYEQQRLEEQSLESVEIGLRARGIKARLAPMVEIIVAAGTSLVLWFGAREVLAGTLSAGSLVLFFFYLGKMYKPMQGLSKMSDSYSKASVAFERIRETLDMHGDVRDLPRAMRAPRLRGLIEFEHVTFGYDPARPVCSDLNFRIEPGQVAALVGPTGAGKTTIVSLIPRFYDPISGAVKIDGLDIRRFKIRSLREQMSFVLQETVLFHAPVWQNIAYGKPTASREEILSAAREANAAEFIEKMPEGYNTIVGERGVTLSGGQRQRIAIARAIIRNTPILILDEPTSGLDAESERLVVQALERLMRGRTTIVIAHRLSTIRRADQIFVVCDGWIAEHGRHDELRAAGGIYAKLYETQFGLADDAQSAPADHPHASAIEI